MTLVLCDLTWNKILVYIDDVIILRRSFVGSLKKFEIVTQKFELHNLKQEPEKCSLLSTEVHFLGRKEPREDVSVTNDHIKSVRN